MNWSNHKLTITEYSKCYLRVSVGNVCKRVNGPQNMALKLRHRTWKAGAGNLNCCLYDTMDDLIFLISLSVTQQSWLSDPKNLIIRTLQNQLSAANLLALLFFCDDHSSMKNAPLVAPNSYTVADGHIIMKTS